MSERIQAINMPRWGMTMTEGLVAGWLVPEGATIAADQEVVEIETTKITNVMEAGRAGVLRRIVVQPGNVAPVGALLAVVADSSVPDEEIEAFVAAKRSETRSGAGEGGPAARLIEADGFRINVQSLGGGDAAPIVLLHGFGGDLGTWLFNQEPLAADRPVHAIDLPGHGGSPPEVGDCSLAALAEAVAATLDAIGVDAQVVTTSPIKISCHVASEEAERTVRALHSAFELDSTDAERAHA